MANNMKSWLPLGIGVLSNVTPRSLATLFPNWANMANNCFTICIQAHESNQNTTLVWIGDGTLTAGATEAGFVLVGHDNVIKFENQNANNSLDLDEFYLLASLNQERVRVYALVG
jgi:hypothetical protein